MKLSLELDQEPDHVFTFGDSILGELELKTEVSTYIKSMIVRISGISLTNVEDTLSPRNRRTVRKIIDDKIVLFPKPQDMTDQPLELSAGKYLYSFIIDINDPAKYDDLLDPNISPAGYGVLGEYKCKKVNIPLQFPPSFNHKSLQGNAKVTYSLIGELVLENGKVIQTTKKIRFAPLNRALAYSLRHLCQLYSRPPNSTPTLLRNTCFLETQITVPVSNKHCLQKGFLNIKSSQKSKMNIPLVVACEFKPYLPRHTSLAVSNRFLQTHNPLSDFINIHIVSPLSPSTIQALTGSTQTPIKLEYFKISLTQKIIFGSTAKRLDTKDIPLIDIEEPLSLDFKPIPAERYQLSSSYLEKWEPFLDHRQYYQFTVPKKLLSKPIPNLPQSFIYHNIQNDYHLDVKSIIGSGNHRTPIGCDCPVVMLGPEEQTVDVVPEYSEKIRSGEVFVEVTNEVLPMYSL
ncbi:hypothetical protein DASC09_029040 [Saccharomycopsis crataegensis]|uniref:Arrestin-like N-terminal domain-containing protein n=1 Tax=Saccharomycopsis crataegensis TaxID=43959 RepID=A0AAV5QMB2_9ASCO|nr:hypothetical protein DASC09_029040 [Saccharomycopsis crataegensis]